MLAHLPDSWGSEIEKLDFSETTEMWKVKCGRPEFARRWKTKKTYHCRNVPVSKCRVRFSVTYLSESMDFSGINISAVM